MFGTLKYNQSSGDAYLVETTKPPFDIQETGKQQTNACTNCREKKLKCTGERTGCRRCRTKGNRCIYIEPGSNKNRRQSIARRRNSEQQAAARSPLKSTNSAVSTRPASRNDGNLSAVLEAPSAATVPFRRQARSPKDHGGEHDFTNGGMMSPRLSSALGMSSAMSVDGTEPLSATDGLYQDMFDFSMGGPAVFGDNVNDGLNFGSDMTDLSDNFDPNAFLNDPLMMDESMGDSSNYGTSTTEQQQQQLSVPPVSSSASMDSRVLSRATSDSNTTDSSSSNKSLVSQITSPSSAGQSRPPSLDIKAGNPFAPPGAPVAAPANTINMNTISAGPCQCMSMVLRIDERLKLYVSGNGTRSVAGSAGVPKVDEDLLHLKGALVCCNAVLDCVNCSGQSFVIMLILSICEKMLVAFEQLCCAMGSNSPRTRQRNSSQATQQALNGSPWSSTQSSPMNSAKGPSIGEHKLDVEDEAHILNVLVVARMKILNGLLNRLEGNILANGYDGHQEVLHNVKRNFARMQEVMSKIDS